MSWKDKLEVATVIFEILIVAPLVWLIGNMTDLWSQIFIPTFEYSWLAYVLVALVLNGFYAMGLLLIMGLIDFARRPRDEATFGMMKIGRK